MTFSERSLLFKDYLNQIYERAKLIRSGKVKLKDDNMLKITTDGKEISWNYSTCKEFKVAATKVPRTWIGKEEKNREHIKCILRDLKEALWEKGILSYDDCYAIAQLYINQHPQIKEIIRNRFKYVFIDETQDLQAHQLEMTDQ